MRESEFEQLLDVTLRELDGELEAEVEPDWNTRHLIEFQSGPGDVFGVFSARISGFDLHKTTSPDPDVIPLQNAAADRIAREIVARFNEIHTLLHPSPQCIFVTLTGFVDKSSESDTRDFGLDSERAKATLNGVQARLNALAEIDRGRICLKVGKAGSDPHLLDVKPLFPSTTAVGRHLNRRVVAKVWMSNCPPGGCKQGNCATRWRWPSSVASSTRNPGVKGLAFVG
jgi:hypothetical protein